MITLISTPVSRPPSPVEPAFSILRPVSGTIHRQGQPSNFHLSPVDSQRSNVQTFKRANAPTFKRLAILH
jgi:hypothetical protein